MSDENEKSYQPATTGEHEVVTDQSRKLARAEIERLGTILEQTRHEMDHLVAVLEQTRQKWTCCANASRLLQNNCERGEY